MHSIEFTRLFVATLWGLNVYQCVVNYHKYNNPTYLIAAIPPLCVITWIYYDQYRTPVIEPKMVEEYTITDLEKQTYHV